MDGNVQIPRIERDESYYALRRDIEEFFYDEAELIDCQRSTWGWRVCWRCSR